MTKKDYIKIAAVLNHFLNEANDRDQVEFIGNVSLSLGKIFKDNNPRFDMDLFKKAVIG